MRISDWSSDVCSSDLLVARLRPRSRNPAPAILPRSCLCSLLQYLVPLHADALPRLAISCKHCIPACETTRVRDNRGDIFGPVSMFGTARTKETAADPHEGQRLLRSEERCLETESVGMDGSVLQTSN